MTYSFPVDDPNSIAGIHQPGAFPERFFEHAPDFFLALDSETKRVLWCNQALCTQLQRERNELIGQSIDSLCHPTSQEDLAALLNGVRGTEQSATSTVYFLGQAPDVPIEVALRASPIVNDRGTVTGVLIHGQSTARPGTTQGAPPSAVHADLSAVVRETSELLQVASADDVALDYELQDPGPVVQIDVRLLRQAVMALILHAIRAGDGTGLTIRSGSLRATAEDLDAITRRFQALPGRFGWFEIGVADRQPGPFDLLRADGQTTREPGLAAALGAAQSCGGALDLGTTPSGGSCVRVLLPQATAGSPEHPPRASEPQRPERRGLVLVADDEEHVRAVMQRMLIKAGYGVVTATDGKEAVELYRERSDDIHLIVLDGAMPRMDGLEAMEAIFSHDPAANIILMSGYARSDFPLDDPGPQPAGFLRKPFGMQALLKLVNELTPDDSEPSS